jgi:hypothetical protein
MSGPDRQIFDSYPTRHVKSIPIYLDSRIRSPQAGLSRDVGQSETAYPCGPSDYWNAAHSHAGLARALSVLVSAPKRVKTPDVGPVRRTGRLFDSHRHP